jgi:flagellum-specific peptidoglycan hydrolase FlgJ
MPFLFDIKTSQYKAWAKGLKKAGYATDPKYPDKLISLIERFDLTRFDKKYRMLEKSKKENCNSARSHSKKRGYPLLCF